MCDPRCLLTTSLPRLSASRAREWFGPDPVALFSPRLDSPMQFEHQPGMLPGHSVNTVPEAHAASDPAHAGGLGKCGVSAAVLEGWGGDAGLLLEWARRGR